MSGIRNSDSELPEEVFFVILEPHPVEEICRVCRRWSYDKESCKSVYGEPNPECRRCEGAGVWIRPPHRQKKTHSQRLYARRAGASTLRTEHKGCCTVKVYSAKIEWEEVSYKED